MLEAVTSSDDAVRVARQNSHDECKNPRRDVPLSKPSPRPENAQDHQQWPAATIRRLLYITLFIGIMAKTYKFRAPTTMSFPLSVH